MAPGTSSQDHKMPVLKQLGPVQPKKRPERGVLSISAPLGDLRHTLHVGRGGDAFGDTSFLSRPGGAGPPPEPLAPPSGASHSATPASPPPPPADPLLSFHLDLGPSMLDAVLGVMDVGRSEATAQPGEAPGAAAPPTPARSRSSAESERAATSL